MSDPLEIARRESSVLRISVRTAVIMLGFTLVFTALMAGTYKLTEPLVAASAATEKLRLIGEVLPPEMHNNDVMADAIILPPQKALGSDEDTRVWRARKAGLPVALVLEAAARDGYSGRIALIMAVAADGRLLALRVTRKPRASATISTRRRTATKPAPGSPSSMVSVWPKCRVTSGA
jgi:electron transport complex protein RnfG